jgi:hypothetical protein
LYNNSEEIEELGREEDVTPEELGPAITKAEFEKSVK